MSKVRNALRVAGTWPQERDSQAAAQAQAQPYLVVATATEQVTEVEPHTRSLWERLSHRIRAQQGLRYLRRWMGKPTVTPVARCGSVTRRGLPCRAPAMANGLCRMHGGAHRPPTSESRGRLSGTLHEQYEAVAHFTSTLLSRFAKSEARH